MHKQALSKVKSLKDLQALICEWEQEAREQGIEGTYPEDVDYSDLPTFGGEMPKDTYKVWSWDATSLLVGSGPGHDGRIISREEWENK